MLSQGVRALHDQHVQHLPASAPVARIRAESVLRREGRGGYHFGAFEAASHVITSRMRPDVRIRTDHTFTLYPTPRCAHPQARGLI
eukprot:1188032-Prorocentrum_minimum.AAC.4